VRIASLARGAAHERRVVKSVRLLGVAHALEFQQTDESLIVNVPDKLPARHAAAFKISFA
jgi:alpha-L-fucosidase